MQKQKNQSGMALLSVLLVIIIFSIIGTVIINLTVSNAKQVDLVEQDMQAVDIAEMGVIYYKNKLIVKADNVITTAIENAIAQITNENSNNKKQVIPINPTTVLARINTQNISILPNDVSIGAFIPVGEGSNFSYKITDHFTLPSGEAYKLSIAFKSFGKARNDSAMIDGLITLNIEDLVKAYFGEGNPSSIRNEIIQKPNLPQKVYNPSIGLENGYAYSGDISNYKKPVEGITALIDGSFYLNNGNRVKRNSFLYITKNADFGNSQKSDLENLKIFVGKNAYFKNTKASIKNSIMYIYEDMEFHNHIGDITNSKICVRGSIIDPKKKFPVPSEKWSEGSYTCYFFSGSTSVTGSDISEAIADQVDNMKLDYK